MRAEALDVKLGIKPQASRRGVSFLLTPESSFPKSASVEEAQ